VLPIDAAFPLQRLGGGLSPAPRSADIPLLVATVAAYLSLEPAVQTVANNGTLTVPAGRLLRYIVLIQNGTSRTVNVGLTSGGLEVVDGATVQATKDEPIGVLVHNQAASQVLHFHGFSGSLSVKLYY
jgi:hypothetical protein